MSIPLPEDLGLGPSTHRVAHGHKLTTVPTVEGKVLKYWEAVLCTLAMCEDAWVRTRTGSCKWLRCQRMVSLQKQTAQEWALHHCLHTASHQRLQITFIKVASLHVPWEGIPRRRKVSRDPFFTHNADVTLLFWCCDTPLPVPASYCLKDYWLSQCTTLLVLSVMPDLICSCLSGCMGIFYHFLPLTQAILCVSILLCRGDFSNVITCDPQKPLWVKTKPTMWKLWSIWEGIGVSVYHLAEGRWGFLKRSTNSLSGNKKVFTAPVVWTPFS